VEKRRRWHRQQGRRVEQRRASRATRRVTMATRRTKRERGVVLLLVLWVFMTLGVLAMDFSTEMRDDASATMNLADQTRAYYAAVAGMNRALYENTLWRKKNPTGVVPTNNVDPSKDEEDLDGDGKPDTPKFKADGDW